MNETDFDAVLADFRAELGDIVDRLNQRLSGAAELEAFPEDFVDWTAEDLDHFTSAPVAGWALVVERTDPMRTRAPGFLRVVQAPMQSPSHTRGLLFDALEWSKPE